MKLPKYEEGIIRLGPLLIIIATLGIISFLLITATFPFKGQFSTIYPKIPSQAATNQIYWGAYIDGLSVYGAGYETGPWDCNVGATTCPTWDLFQSHTGKNTSLMHFGFGGCWISASNCYQFNAVVPPMNAIVARANIPLLDLNTYGKRDIDIANGVDDGPITIFAQQVKAWGHPFFLRFETEMNGSWEDWGPNNSFDNTPAQFIQMWQHVHDIFVAQGANNVTWVWCPNNETPSQASNPSDITNAANWYPGDSYVDWTCFDAYNFGGLYGSNSWQTWDQVAMPVYNHLLQFAPSKPIMVAETASTEIGAPAESSKATWITDVLTNLPIKYPQIKAYSWFDWYIPDTKATADNGKDDWQIESSTTSQNAFAQGITSSYYATNTFATPPLNSSGKILPPSTISSTPSPSSSPTPNPSITTTPSPTPTCNLGPEGDINCDGEINIFDYNILVTNFGKSGVGVSGDLNADGTVNIFDYNILVTNFGKSV